MNTRRSLITYNPRTLDYQDKITPLLIVAIGDQDRMIHHLRIFGIQSASDNSTINVTNGNNS